MKVTFSPELPPDDEWNDVRRDIIKALSHFEEIYREFPSEVFVRLETVPYTAKGVAVSPDSSPIMEISYSLLAPHEATYNYVGPSKPVELPEGPDAEA